MFCINSVDRSIIQYSYEKVNSANNIFCNNTIVALIAAFTVFTFMALNQTVEKLCALIIMSLRCNLVTPRHLINSLLAVVTQDSHSFVHHTETWWHLRIQIKEIQLFVLSWERVRYTTVTIACGCGSHLVITMTTSGIISYIR
jgi:hypothetical protein